MKINHLDFDVYLKKAFKNPRIKAEYDRLQPEFALIDALIQARAKKNLTQKQLAKKIGTKQSAISRLESFDANPSFKFLKKVAKAFDAKLVVQFQ